MKLILPLEPVFSRFSEQEVKLTRLVSLDLIRVFSVVSFYQQRDGRKEMHPVASFEYYSKAKVQDRPRAFKSHK